MALRLYNTEINGKKVKLVSTVDVANEMNDMEEQVLQIKSNLDEEYKFMWLALKQSFAKDKLNEMERK